MLSNFRKKLSGLMLTAILLNSWGPLAAQAFSTSGPSNTSEGFTIVEGNPLPFDYEITDYPVFELQSETDPEPGQPSAWFHVEVDYGDGQTFVEDYPAIAHPYTFHIKDRTLFRNDSIFLDDSHGFLFNENPEITYPQDHTYAAGNYTLNIRAELQSDLVDTASFTPLNINVPVNVLTQSEAPNFAFDSFDYDPVTDIATAMIRYTGPQEVMVFDPAQRDEWLNNFWLSLDQTSGHATSVANAYFHDWEMVSQAPIPGSDQYETMYRATFLNAGAQTQDDLLNENLSIALIQAWSSGYGGAQGWIVLDGVLEDNSANDYSYAANHSNFAINLAGSTNAHVNEETGLALTWSEPAATATQIDVSVNWGDGSLPESSNQPVNAASVALTHTYTTAGTYPVEVCANDSVVNVCQTVEITATDFVPVDGLNVMFGTDANTPYSNPLNLTQGESRMFNVFISGIPETATTLTIQESFSGTNMPNDSQTWTGPWIDNDLSDTDIDTVITMSRTPLEPGSYTYQVCAIVDANAPTCGEQNVQVWSTFSPLGVDAAVGTPIYEGEPAHLMLDIFNVHPEATELNAQIAWNAFDPSAQYELDVNTRDQVAEFDYVYPAPGSYTITYCVEDSRGVDAGGRDCGTQVVEVLPLPMQLAFDQETITVNEDEPVSITGLVSHVPAEYAEVDLGIDYGAGESGTSELVSPAEDRTIEKTWQTVFAEPGTYQVSACARVDGIEACDELMVEVLNYDLQVELLPAELTTVMREEAPVTVRVSNINSNTTSLTYETDWGTDTRDGNVTGVEIPTNGASELTFTLTPIYTTEGTWGSQVCFADADGDRPCGNMTVHVNSDATFEEDPLSLVVNGSELTNQDTPITLSADLSNIGHQSNNMHVTVDWKDGSMDVIDQPLSDPYDISIPLTHTYTTRGVRYVDVCADDGRWETCVSHRVFTMAPDLYAGILSVDPLNGIVNVRMGNEGEFDLPVTDGITRITVNGVELDRLTWSEDEFNPAFYLNSHSINDRAFDLDLTNPAVDPTGVNTVEVCIDAEAVTADRLRDNNCGSTTFTIPSIALDVTATELNAVQFVPVSIPVTISDIVEGTESVMLNVNFGTPETDLGESASYEVITEGNSTVNAELPVTFTHEGSYVITVCTANDLAVCDTTSVTVEPRLSVELTDGLTFTQNEESQFTAWIRNIAEGTEEVTYDVHYDLQTADGYLLNGTVALEGALENATNVDVIFTEAGTGTIEFCAHAGEEDRCETTSITVESDATFEDGPLTVDAYGSSEAVATQSAFTLYADVTNFDHQASAYDYTIDWGDGTQTDGTTTLENPFDRTLSTEHTYSNRGSYTVRGCIDDGRGAVCDEVAVSVTGVDLYVEGMSMDASTGMLTYTLGNQGEETSRATDGTTQIELNGNSVETMTWNVDDADTMSSYLNANSSAEKTFDLDLFGSNAQAGDNTVMVCVDTTEVSGDSNTTNNCATLHFEVTALSLALDAESTTIALGDAVNIAGQIAEIMDGTRVLNVTVSEGESTLATQTLAVEADPQAFEVAVSLETAGTHELNVCATDGVQSSCETLTVSVETSDLFAAITSFDSETGLLTYQIGNNGNARPFNDNGQNSIAMKGIVFSFVDWQTDANADLYLNAESSTTLNYTFPMDDIDLTPGEVVSIEVCADAGAVSSDSNTANNCAQTSFTVPEETSSETTAPSTPVSGGGFSGGGSSSNNNRGGNDDVELASEEPAFTDVDGTSPYFEPVQYLYDKGIVQGYEDQTFRPENITNRAEFVKLITVSLGEEPTLEEYSNCFPDVTTQWYAPYVCYAKAEGWIQGYADGLFRPEQTVNRVESLKMVVNGFELDLDKRKDMMIAFTDVIDNAWYEIFVEVALSFKLIDVNSDHLLRPGDGMTRGDLAEILFRALELK